MKIKSSHSLQISLIIIFFFLNQKVQAQKKTFDAYLIETNLIYNPPKGYTNFQVVEHADVPAKPGAPSVLWNLIQNWKKDILIGFSLIPLRQHLSRQSRDVNANLTKTALNQADTTKSKIYSYNVDELTSVNAMRAVRYDLDMDSIVFGKYDKCKVVILQRDNIGDGFMYYFYNHNTKGEIDDEIKNTSNMLKFLPDNKFNPLIYKKD